MPDPLAAELGRRGEEIAARLLERRGWRILERGFLAARGEIDLVARDGARLVVVEVKTRSSWAFGAPAEAIDARKRRALAAAAAEYRLLADWRGPIDYAVVALTVNSAGSVSTAEVVEGPLG